MEEGGFRDGSCFKEEERSSGIGWFDVRSTAINPTRKQSGEWKPLFKSQNKAIVVFRANKGIGRMNVGESRARKIPVWFQMG